MVDHERKIAPACVGVGPPRQHPRKVARNSIERSFNKRRKRCNSNETHSRFETVAGELRAKLVSVGGCAGCGARGRWRGLAGHTRTIVTAGVEGAGGTGGPGRTSRRGLAAAPVGGGGAWPGFETTRRAKLAARTVSGRAAAHGRTKQPGPTAGSDGARNTSGATNTNSDTNTTKRAGTSRFRPALDAQWLSALRDRSRRCTTGNHQRTTGQ